MERIVRELKNAGVFFVATGDGDQPRVRPFSSITLFEGCIYLCTNNTKDVYRQIMKNPRVEICALQQDKAWIRVAGILRHDPRDEAKSAMLADETGPSHAYHVGDGIFEVFRLEVLSAIKSRYLPDKTIQTQHLIPELHP